MRRSQFELFDHPTLPNLGMHHREEWKCLSLLQPWAGLVVDGFKKQDTRSWDTDYRGIIYIHASKTIPTAARKLLSQWPFNLYVREEGLITGAIIGRVELVKTERSERCLQKMKLSANTDQVNEEFHFGDYSPNRFVWHLQNPQKLKEPIPVTGALQLWTYKSFQLSSSAFI
ncbi:MAG TPA: ASCH domain-containing protein [Cyclobacteriaceae bacterium]|nr:ASCH domain-containing protein [Cyclobacteriaceae bacterium]